MMVGLVVSVIACGDDDNPVKSNQELLVGTWTIGDISLTFRPDGTIIESEPDDEDDKGIWSLAGDQLTLSDSDGSNSETYTVNFITDTEMILTSKTDDVDGPLTLTKKA